MDYSDDPETVMRQIVHDQFRRQGVPDEKLEHEGVEDRSLCGDAENKDEDDE